MPLPLSEEVPSPAPAGSGPRRDAAVVFWGVLLVIAGAFAGIVLVLPVLPFVDYPSRIAAATIYRAQTVPFGVLRQYYAVVPDAFAPNTLFVWIAGSGLFSSADRAGHLWFAVYTVSFPLLVSLLIRRFRGDVWLGLLALLVVFNSNVAWGFTEFSMAIPIALAWVWALASFDERPSWRSAALLAVLLGVLYLTHVLMMLFVAIVLGVYAVVFVRDRRRAVPVGIILGVGLALVMLWWGNRRSEATESLGSFLANYYRSTYLQTWALRKALLVGDNRQLYAGRLGTGVAFLVSLAILGPALVGAVRLWRPSRALIAPGLRVVAVVGFTALVSVVGAPDRVPGQPALFDRFPVVVMVAAIVIAGVARVGGGGRRFRTALVLVALVYAGARAEYFLAFSRAARDFTPALLPEATADNTMLGLMFDRTFRGHPVYIHYPDYFIAWKGGATSTELTAWTYRLIDPAAAAPAVLPAYHSMPGDRTYSPADLHTRYLLVRGTAPSWLDVDARYGIERRAGSWVLWRRLAPAGMTNQTD